MSNTSDNTNIRCPVPGCTYQTGSLSEIVAVALLTAHTTTHQASQSPIQHGPKLERPTIDIGVAAEEFKLFERRWKIYAKNANIPEEQAATQLLECTSTKLGDAVLRMGSDIATQSEDEMLNTIRSLAVIPVATMVQRSELLSMRQSRDEPFRSFFSRVRGKAEICGYSIEHTCGCGRDSTVDFTKIITRDVIIAGIYDEEIRRRLMSANDLCKKSSNDIVALVEAEEMARNAVSSSTIALSTNKPVTSTPAASPTESKREKAVCPKCRKEYFKFKKGRFGWNKKPHTMCTDCHQRERRQLQLQEEQSNNTVCLSQVSSISQEDSSGDKKDEHPSVPRACKIAPIRLSHHIFSKGEWKRARFNDHPTINLSMSINQSHYISFGVKIPDASDMMVTCIADTGAQSNLWSLKQCKEMGFKEDDLIPVNSTLSAANKSRIEISGAVLLNMSGIAANGTEVTRAAMVYVSASVKGFYLSYDTMLDLGIIPASFPSIGDALIRTPLNDCIDLAEFAAADTPKCSCPSRQPIPPRPPQLPFQCTEENISSMRDWLLKTFSASTFNTCPHQPLPCMNGPPIEMHIDQSATPRVCHTAANVPLHWQEKVKADLERDVDLGVIERVPYGEPVTWCHRMVVTRKHDGTPRRTVDLSPLNKFCKRETFAAESPFHLARKVPGNTWKTVTDAWNGYHSVPLRDSDRHLTTFITPFGRFRYKRAPQGFVSSGDGYNRRFDAILAEFTQKERCVDDTIHYDTDLEQHWWRTIDFLRTVGAAGIVLNPSKFQFCQKSVEFAGFRVGESSIKPLPKYLDAIRDFPTPKSITDIRSWFGLVNQVANYAQLRGIMAPFRQFLSPKNHFEWSAELENAFEQSKESIIAAIVKGVEIFDLTRKTCMRPDWSKQGIGYFLLQKHCSCASNLPDCCNDGWRIVLAGSRFLSSAEQRYAPIEGEALAVAWGLEQSKYFTQGCEDLIVVTDHKPLVKILGDRTLDEIPNTRLFRLKQRTLPWRFSIHHLPGKTNYAADATSRNPSLRINDYADDVSRSLYSTCDEAEVSHTVGISDDFSASFSLSWSDLESATAADATLHRLSYLIQNGFPSNKGILSDELSSYWNYRDALYVCDGVVMYNDRVVVPKSLRPTVLTFLHSAHQGVTMMEARARSIIFWPGMSRDIKKKRDSCVPCCRNAPSQAATPAIPAQVPMTPFESIAADYFESHGHNFLVIADRLSGWTEIFSCNGSTKSNADGLVANLRCLFRMFGVPTELSSDGGPQFRASVTEDFLARWGVHHRISSAYFPQSNGRAEVAVKTAKRLLLDNIGPSGSLNSDKFLRAMLQLRNTPDPDCNLSPAEIVFGRKLRDAFSFVNRVGKFQNRQFRPIWRDAWKSKEVALRTRFTRNMERLNSHARYLPPLQPGERVFVQNQVGNHPGKWDRSGIVVEANGNDQYLVKIDGSGRVSLRNRRFLRSYTPASPTIAGPTPAAPLMPVDYQHVEDVPEPTLKPDDAPTLPATDVPRAAVPDTSLPPPQADVPQTQPQINDPPCPDPPAQTPQRPHRERKQRLLYRADTGTWEAPR